MNIIYARIPESAARHEIDGHMYAHISAHIKMGTDGKVHVHAGHPDHCRMLRLSFVKNGEGYVEIGRVGDAIFSSNDVPFGCTVLRGDAA